MLARLFMPTAMLASLALCASAAVPVTLHEADEVIPTYRSGPPDLNPMFHFGRMSQGAEGRIYPYPLYDNLTNQKGEQSYHLIYLENEYVKISIAPELGGRLFSALDKTNGYDFVYRQHVIKPALIGLIGAWISGGIEWNIPHHHRASTFNPVQWRVEQAPDGSKTVWVGELEVRHRMRWAVGYTLRPGSSVLECSLRIANRTPLEQTMLCFANVAVTTNKDYQIIFPPATQWVTFHDKKEFSQWPVSRQHYNWADFTAGVDVSWWKNHIKPTSMFAWDCHEDFFAGYDHGKQAGIMSVADHHIVPGKKFWTWGSGPVGRMWDDILTDTDGPYIELMVGAYSDNQPDYSWLQPFETRAFEMNWYPFRDIGGVKNANLEAAVNLEVKQGVAEFGFYTTKEHPAATIRLTASNKVLVEEKIAITPAKPYRKKCVLPQGVDEHELRASLAIGGRELVSYAPVRLKPVPQPEPYRPPAPPKKIENGEELFLAGQRADQFHNPTLDADPFWDECLRRDPGNVDANIGMGRLHLRRAQFPAAEACFQRALDRLTAGHTVSRNAEPLYGLGLALKAQGKNDEAAAAFQKAAWSQAWKSPAYCSLAQLAATRGDFAATLDFAQRSLDANALNLRAYALKAAALRHMDRKDEALAVLALAAEKTDPLDVLLMAERWLLARDGGQAGTLFATLHDHPATAQELATDYANAGLLRDGAVLLNELIARAPDQAKLSPLIYYYLADFSAQLGDAAKASACRATAAKQSPDYVFPFQAELVSLLRAAMQANPTDARAPYYLGNLLFDWQADEAISLWNKAAGLDPQFLMVWRNLAQAYAHQAGDTAHAQAVTCMEKAVALPGATTTHFSELDLLYQQCSTPVEKRLALLESNRSTVIMKDEGRGALITLLTFVGKPDEAIALLQQHTFNIWEDGSQFNTGRAWFNAHLTRGRQRMRAGQFEKAIADFQVASNLPSALRASELGRERLAELRYWIGCAQMAQGHEPEARLAWNEAVKVADSNDGPPMAAKVAAYFQILSLRKLGEHERAQRLVGKLAKASAQSPPNTPASATPAKPGESPRELKVMAHFIAGLGHSAAGDKNAARTEFNAALALCPDHLGAKQALADLAD